MTVKTPIDLPPESGSRNTIPPDILREILRAIAGVEFGSVEVVIHNARVTQIEVRKKVRYGA